MNFWCQGEVSSYAVIASYAPERASNWEIKFIALITFEFHVLLFTHSLNKLTVDSTV